VLNPQRVDDAELASAGESESASATAKRTQLNRWAISFALALLLHAVAAVVVLLIWQQSKPFNRNGPVFVELPPPTATPTASPGEAAPQPQPVEQPRVGELNGANRGPGGPPKRADDIAEQKVPSAEEGRAENPAVRTPPENAEGENARTVSGGGAVSSGPSGSEIAGGPIDARIAPRFGPAGPRARKAPRALARKATTMGRTAKSMGAQAQGHSRRLGASPSVAINAIGAHVQDRAAAAIARAQRLETSKNAIGSGSVANLAGSLSASAAGLAVTNAIGMTVHAHPTIPAATPRLTGGEQITGAAPLPFASRGPPAAAINGTTMNRVTLNSGVIGGPAKNTVGVLNGTGFRMRRP
jgi:hypothetical protein